MGGSQLRIRCATRLRWEIGPTKTTAIRRSLHTKRDSSQGRGGEVDAGKKEESHSSGERRRVAQEKLHNAFHGKKGITDRRKEDSPPSKKKRGIQ